MRGPAISTTTASALAATALGNDRSTHHLMAPRTPVTGPGGEPTGEPWPERPRRRRRHEREAQQVIARRRTPEGDEYVTFRSRRKSTASAPPRVGVSDCAAVDVFEAIA